MIKTLTAFNRVVGVRYITESNQTGVKGPVWNISEGSIGTKWNKIQ